MSLYHRHLAGEWKQSESGWNPFPMGFLYVCEVAIKERNSMDTADQNGHRIQTSRPFHIERNSCAPLASSALQLFDFIAQEDVRQAQWPCNRRGMKKRFGTSVKCCGFPLEFLFFLFRFRQMQKQTQERTTQ